MSVDNNRYFEIIPSSVYRLVSLGNDYKFVFIINGFMYSLNTDY